MKFRTLLLIVAAILLMVLLLLPFRPYTGRGVAPAGLPPLVVWPAQSQPAATDRLNLNTATEAELQALPNIGPVRAQRIVAYRQNNGPFQSVEELAAVDGIDLGILEQVRDRLFVITE